MYATAVPPGGLQFSIQQNSPQHKNSTPTFNFKQVHQLVNALKGKELHYDERVSIVETLYSLDSVSRTDLIDFLSSSNGVIASTLENNACKHFVCTPDEFSQILKTRNFNDLLDFWTFIQLTAVPNFLAIAYPLEDPDTFPIRQTIFTALRNKVLLPMLKSYNFDQEERVRVRPVLSAVCFLTTDRSKKHRAFRKLADRVFFEDESHKELNETPTALMSHKEVVHTQSNQSIYHKMSTGQLEQCSTELSSKPRSKTLPKSVRWENLIKVDETQLSVDI